MTDQPEPQHPYQFTCLDCGDHVVSYIRFGYDRQQCSLCHYISCIPDPVTRDAMRIALRKTKLTLVQTPEVSDDT